MAPSPGYESAKMLKDRKKKKSAPAADPMGDDSVESVLAELDASLGAEEGVGEAMADEDMVAGEEAGLDSDMASAAGMDTGMGTGMDADAGAKVFADVLGMDEMTAMAVYNEAMSLPELAEMDAAAMADKINGNYELLKNILMSMGEKAAMVMQEQIAASPAPPEMAPPGAGELPPGM
tara:strand:- start:1574 stop:2107 length:534 start_codon:yes stop_codon:yes gene_type:complete